MRNANNSSVCLNPPKFFTVLTDCLAGKVQGELRSDSNTEHSVEWYTLRYPKNPNWPATTGGRIAVIHSHTKKSGSDEKMVDCNSHVRVDDGDALYDLIKALKHQCYLNIDF